MTECRVALKVCVATTDTALMGSFVCVMRMCTESAVKMSCCVRTNVPTTETVCGVFVFVIQAGKLLIVLKCLIQIIGHHLHLVFCWPQAKIHPIGIKAFWSLKTSNFELAGCAISPVNRKIL